MKFGEDFVQKYDLSSLSVLGTVGKYPNTYFNSLPKKKTREIKCEKNKTMQKNLGTLKFLICTYIT